eukprot:5186198-Karenia_brevis.AAC.1
MAVCQSSLEDMSDGEIFMQIFGTNLDMSAALDSSGVNLATTKPGSYVAADRVIPSLVFKQKDAPQTMKHLMLQSEAAQLALLRPQQFYLGEGAMQLQGGEHLSFKTVLNRKTL